MDFSASDGSRHIGYVEEWALSTGLAGHEMISRQNRAAPSLALKDFCPTGARMGRRWHKFTGFRKTAQGTKSIGSRDCRCHCFDWQSGKARWGPGECTGLDCLRRNLVCGHEVMEKVTWLPPERCHSVEWELARFEWVLNCCRRAPRHLRLLLQSGKSPPFCPGNGNRPTLDEAQTHH